MLKGTTLMKYEELCEMGGVLEVILVGRGGKRRQEDGSMAPDQRFSSSALEPA